MIECQLRAEAQLREEKAALPERGLADRELIDENERDHFAGTSAVADDDEVPAADRRDDEAEVGSRRAD